MFEVVATANGFAVGIVAHRGRARNAEEIISLPPSFIEYTGEIHCPEQHLAACKVVAGLSAQTMLGTL